MVLGDRTGTKVLWLALEINLANSRLLATILDQGSIGSFSFVLVRAVAARLHAPGHVQIRKNLTAGTGLDGSGQRMQFMWADFQAQASILEPF